MKKIKSVLLWIVTGFFALAALVYFPSFSSVCSILICAFAIPIPKWQAIIAQFIKGKLKIIIVVVMVILAIFTAPTTEDEPESPSETLATTISTQATTEETTTPFTNETTDFTTESSSAPTAEATTATIAPTTEATTAATIASTTEATTPSSTTAVTEPPHEHSFRDATCTDPKTCACGATEGEANGHSWKDATCTEPKTCTACGETLGSAVSHHYADGKCSVCGSKDPNYNPEPMVWISSTGKRYHSYSGCSSMNNPSLVPLSKAKALGLSACGKCH